MYNQIVNSVQDKSLKYFYFMDKNHLLGDKKGRVLLHRHIMSLKLGRWLLPNEIVHHIDGNRENNEITNLELTSRSIHAKMHNKKLKEKICPICKKDFQPRYSSQKYCSKSCSNYKCGNSLCKINSIEIRKLIWEKPSVYIAKLYGVSDTAIIKFCKKWKISKPPRGYWQKRNKTNN